MVQKFEKLLQKKDLNDRKWSLLYRGSRDGFEASNFHLCCDGKPNTLTIVKSTKGYIFGGYTNFPWDRTNAYKHDNNAFIFSLLNNEKNRSLIFENSKDFDNQYSLGSIYSNSFVGPIFGRGHDLFISDRSNENESSHSSLGYTFTHPDYPKDSVRAYSILAGSKYFRVDEIEIFQMKE